MSYDIDPDVAAFSTPGKGTISDDLLNNLRSVESSNRAWITHPTSGAMGAYQHLPKTVEMLSKKYGKYNPYNEPEARERTRQYLEELVKSNKGDINIALKQYGGFVTKDPSQYIAKVTGQPAVDPDIEAFTFKPAQETQETGAAFGNPNLTRQGQRAGVTGLTSESAKRFEDVASLPYQAAVPLAAIAKGVIQSIPEAIKTGQQPAPIGYKIAEEFQKKYGYTPQTDVLQPLQQLPEALLGSSMTPPLPELAGYANAPKVPIAPFAMEMGQNLMQKLRPVANVGREGLGAAQEAIQAVKGVAPATEAPKPPMAGVGSALTTKQNTVNALISDLSPETQAIVKSAPVENINLPALETKALEEKHGIKLSQGQRTEDIGRYAQEWNVRGKHSEIGDLFNDQASQFRDAIDNIKRKHTLNMGNASGEAFSQKIMDRYAANDAAHVKAIETAYGNLKQRHNEMLAEKGFPTESGMPLDTNAFVNMAKNNLHDEFLMADAEKSGLMGDLGRIEKQGLTLPEFIAFDKRLSRMQRGSDKEAAAAAGQIRNAFDQIPLKEGMEQLMPMYKQAKALAKNRFDKMDQVPGYKYAIEAQPTNEEIGQGIGSTGANKFYDKFISNASTGDLKRIKRELSTDPLAIEALRGAELEKAVKAAGFTGDRGEFSPKRLNDYLETNSANLAEKIGPEALNDLMEINVLGAKVAKPNAGVFNHSNSLSAFLGDMAKQGIQLKAEGALAGATHGASILPVQALKSAAEFINKGKFVSETTNPHAGIIKKGEQ